MNKTVEMSVSEPIYSTHHSQGNSGAVLTKNPSVRNWYLDNSMNLYCTRRFLYGFTTPLVSVEESAYWENPYSEEKLLTRFIEKTEGTVEI